MLQNILKAHRSPVEGVAQKVNNCFRRAELRWVKFHPPSIILLWAESRSESRIARVPRGNGWVETGLSRM
jgi:hypothetical protein